MIPSHEPNQDVSIKDQREYLGFLRFLSQASTSFMSSRSAHMPNAGCSAAGILFFSCNAVSLATGLPRKVTVTVPPCCTFFNTWDVLSLSCFAVTTIGCHLSN